MSKTSLMKLVQRALLLSVMLMTAGVATAQNKATKKADDVFADGGYMEAARLYQASVPQVKDLDEKGRIFFQIGECNRLSTNSTGSLEWYEKSITAQYYSTNPEVYFNYATALQDVGRWEDAIAQYNKYTGRGGEKSKAASRIKACEEAAEKKAGKTRLIVENMTELNTAFFDYALAYSSKKSDEIIISSSRQASTGPKEDPKTGESFMDLFFAERDKKGKWSTPQPLNNTVNTPSNEGVVCFDKDFGTMYYTFCEYNKEDRMACDILTAKRQGNNYTAPEALKLIDREADDSSMVGHPCLSPDDKFLVFASDMPGGRGGKDLWYVTYDKKNDSWSTPKNLGTPVNTSGDEMFPWISDDGHLFFASNGHAGLGGLDIFKAEKTGDMTFAAPANMGYPINSSSDDFAMSLEKGNKASDFSGFFTSNRPGGKGKDDIYYFTMPPLEFTLVGTAYDQETGTPLAGCKVLVKGSDGSDYSLTTDGNGGFSLDKTKVLPGVNYTVDVQKDKYIGTGDKFSTVGLKESTNFAREYFLLPIIQEREYKMPLVLYPYDQTVLLVNDTVNSADSLLYLFNLMIQNPTFVIELNAHTDARGADDYNQRLSQGRAETCVNYLISKGIDPARLKAVGKGEREPRKLLTAQGPFPANTVLTEAYISKLPPSQQESAHQLNRRTVFKILATDFVPKK